LQAPLQLHFGKQDHAIPAESITRIDSAWPSADLLRYDAGHGFNRYGHADYHQESAARAFARSIEFLLTNAR
jgi:carboxymethylenebutenolidase